MKDRDLKEYVWRKQQTFRGRLLRLQGGWAYMEVHPSGQQIRMQVRQLSEIRIPRVVLGRLP